MMLRRGGTVSSVPCLALTQSGRADAWGACVPASGPVFGIEFGLLLV